MATILFLLTLLTCLILTIQIVVKGVKRENVISTVSRIGVVILTYFLFWTISYFICSNVTVPLGTDICFDDWCVTVTKIDKLNMLSNDKPNGQYIVLHIQISNHALGIAQKPSEPRIHIINNKGEVWTYSEKGQKALEHLVGKQISLDQRLDLHETLETELVFDVPQSATELKVLVEEGPFITEFLLHGDNKVFAVDN